MDQGTEKGGQAKENGEREGTSEADPPPLPSPRVEPPADGAACGGVSAHPNRGALHGGQAAAAPFGNGRFPGFMHHGGPVLASPSLFSAYWGGRWKGVAHQARAERLDQFLMELMQSEFMNVLAQYGVGQGQLAGRALLASVPSVLTDSDIQRLIQEQITAGLWPEPNGSADTALFIYLDEDVNVQDTAILLGKPNSDSAFGYHRFFLTEAGNPFPYAVLPAVTDICVRYTCSDDADCSLHLAQTQEQRQTQVTSHLFAEVVTNPQLNAWFDPDPAIGENGDICNGESAALVIGANHWTVQCVYSKSHDMQTNGAAFCASESPVPLPSLLPFVSPFPPD